MRKSQHVSTWSEILLPDGDADHLRLHRCRRTSPWQRCGRLPTLTGPSGCGTFVPQCDSLRRCRARSPTGRPADHWETDREQTHRWSDWPFLQVTVPKKGSVSNFTVPLGGLEPGHYIHVSGLTPQTVWDDQKLILPGAVTTSTEEVVKVWTLHARFYVLEMCLNLLMSVLTHEMMSKKRAIFYQWTLLIQIFLIKIFRKTASSKTIRVPVQWADIL